MWSDFHYRYENSILFSCAHRNEDNDRTGHQTGNSFSSRDECSKRKKEYWVIFDWCERTWTSSSTVQRWNLPWNYSVMCRQSAVDIVALSTAEKPFDRDRKWIFIDFRSLFTPSRSEKKFSTCLRMSWSLFTLLSAVDNWIIQLIFQPAPFHHLLLPNSRGTMAFNECKTQFFFRQHGEELK